MVTTHAQTKTRVNGQSVKKMEWKQTDRQTDVTYCLTFHADYRDRQSREVYGVSIVPDIEVRPRSEWIVNVASVLPDVLGKLIFTFDE